MNFQETLTPLFPPQTVTDKAPAYVNAPLCCGADIYWFPTKFANKKVKDSLSVGSYSHRRFMILLGKSFPSYVKRICKGVGVVIASEYKEKIGFNPNAIWKSTSSTAHLLGIDPYPSSVQYKGMTTRRTYRLPNCNPMSSIAINVTRLEDKIFYLDGFYSTSEELLRGLIGTMRKGDVILAVTTSRQIKDEQNLEASGFRLVVQTYGTHGIDYHLNLYYYRKNK